jgi:aspartate-semialdehyde dehydrogenase
MSEKLKVGILGATGMVGQRFITLLENHPWFEVVTLAASAHSAGKTYAEAVGDRWKMETPMPEYVKNMVVVDGDDAESVASGVDFMFSAVNMPKDQIRAIEERYAKTETPVVSNNSAHRWTPDVPMVVPEINPEHFEVIEHQRKRLGTTRGFIAVKPNCSIQAYTPALAAWKEFEPREVVVSTYQAISGAGKTFKDWPEMVGNIIPFISGEEAKSEKEPLKVFGHVDAAKGMVAWAKENARVSGLQDAPIRWIVDDCAKFVEREIRRGKTYDAIIMDPPSYGRGPGGEVWKLEENLYPFVKLCARVLSDKPLFVILNSYTTGLAPSVLGYILQMLVGRRFGGHVTWDELGLPCTDSGMALPCGATGRWMSK